MNHVGCTRQNHLVIKQFVKAPDKGGPCFTLGKMSGISTQKAEAGTTYIPDPTFVNSISKVERNVRISFVLVVKKILRNQ